MSIEDFPKGVTETEEERKAREQEDKTKDEVDEAKIETGQEAAAAELTPEEAEQKKEEIIVLCEEADEKLEQEGKDLPKDKRKFFEHFAENVEERLKEVGRFIKDYSSTGGLATVAAGSAWVTRYFATCPELAGGNDIVLATMTGVYSGAMAVGAFVEGVRATYRRKEEREGEE